MLPCLASIEEDVPCLNGTCHAKAGVISMGVLFSEEKEGGKEGGKQKGRREEM